MNINIQLNTQSINDAIARLEAYQNSLQSKCAEFAKRMGELGLDVVRAAYDAASYAGTNDIEVHLEFEGNKCKIVANALQHWYYRSRRPW